MPTLSSTIPFQIRFMLQSVNEANADSIYRELCQFADHGIEGSVVILQTCLDHLHFDPTELKNMQLESVLMSIFTYIMEKPNFSTIFCQSLEGIDISEGYLQNLSNCFHLSASEKVGIGLALSDSENPDTSLCGKFFCMAQIEELSAKRGLLNSSEQFQSILMFLQRSEGLSKHVDYFVQMLSLLQSEDANSFVLTPLLSDEMREANFSRNLELFHLSKGDDFDAILSEMEKEMSMGDILKELGYGCTVDASHCGEILSLFLPLTEITISKILGTVAQTYAGLDDNQNTFSTFSMALGYNVSSEQPSFSSWNIDVLVKTIKQLAPNTNWIQVIENLDHEGFYMPNEEAFAFFMSVYKHACQDPFPLHAICGALWKNTDGQLSFLEYAVKAPPEIFTFIHSSRQLVYMDALHSHKLQIGQTNHAWLCIDLWDVLCELAERGHARSVRSMLENPVKHCPEVLLLGMAHTSTAYNLLQNEVFFTLFPMMVKSTVANGLVLHLWHINPDIVLRGFVDAYSIEPDTLTRILDICQELKILSSALEMIPSPCSIRLAALASRKELVDLEKWLSYNLITYKDFFFEECLKFLREIQFGGEQDLPAKSSQHSVTVINLYMETSSTFSKVLKAHTGLLTSSELSEEMEQLHITTMDSNPKLQNGGAADSSVSEGYADDIEAEANSYFHQMFSCQLSIDAMVQMLARFKESSVQREQSIFECMIANLFEEYQFFPKYPERQLKIAAVLFGSVIKHQLVTHLTLGIALRGVLDALRKPADSKMFVFGTKALEQFVDRLIEWPQYCNHILQISHLRATHSELVAFIERALARISSGHFEVDGGSNASGAHHQGSSQATSGHGEVNGHSIAQSGQHVSSTLQLQQRQEGLIDGHHKASVALLNDMKPPLSSGGQPSVPPLVDASGIQKTQNAIGAPAMLSSSPGFVRPSRGASSTKFGSALNIKTLVAAAERRETPIEAPASEIQDKISFIINNISAANVEAKAKEVTEILKEQYYPWFAEYMVMKRASIEPNFHDLYLKFLDKVNSKALNKEIVQATYENCKVLLGSELIKSSSEERSLLKNLGSWLGKLTIGRNQVLRAREIDPKSLIIEAYEKGLMIAVIPFTSKILEPCQSSLAYQPPNPWTMGILGLLAEIYSMPNLKMNLKFDIEVLFKNLSVDLKELTPTSLLKDRRREVEGNPDFSSKDVGISQPQIVGEVKSGIISQLNHVELPLEVASPPNSSGHTHMLSQYAAPLHLSSGTLMEDEKLAALGLSDQLPSAQGLFQATPAQSPFSVTQLPTPIPNIGTHVIINQKLNALGLHLHFQRVVPIAMDRAIKEIVSSIVQRSVSIATQTTKELVLKDYAMESEETRIYNAAHLMVASLSGSLAHVTCKEPLRGSISSHLRNSLQNLGIANELLEQAVQLVTNDNLDLGCAVIEQAATDKAIQTIDGEIAQQLSLRRKHRESIGQTFFDANVYAQGSMGVLPEALRPKPGHLSLSQQRVYEDFVRLPWQNQSSQSSHAMPPGPSIPSSATGVTSSYNSSSGQLSSGFSSGPGNSGFEAVPRPLDAASEGMEPSSAALLSASSIHTGTPDGVIQQSSDNLVSASFSSAASAPELHSMEPSDDVKELGVSSQPLPSHTGSERLGSGISESSLPTRDALDKYQIVAQKLESSISNDGVEAEIQGVVAEVPEIILRCVNRDEAALAMAQKVFKALYENASNTAHVNAFLAILIALRDVCKLVVKELTSWVIYSDEERKFNKDITLGLIRSELLNLAEYNVHMAKLIDGGRNKGATEFAVSLLQTLVIEEPSLISELHSFVDALAKVAAKPGSSEPLKQLIEIARNPVANVAALSGLTAGKEDKARQSRDKKPTGYSTTMRDEHSNVESLEPDPTGFRDKVSSLFVEWYKICELHGTNEAACTHYILGLHQDGLLKGNDMIDRFFRILVELSVSHCLSYEVNSGALHAPQQGQTLSFIGIDIYAKLVFSILKYSPVDQGSSKLSLLSRILAVINRFIQKDSEEKKASFHPIPYFRLFINWLLDLSSLDPVTDGSNFQILAAFANAFHALQPLRVPAFSFAWLELVSHRSFMPKLLTGNGQKGWPHVQRLLVDLFQFLEPYLRNAELGGPVRLLYKGTLRMLLVLLHDFPEFLCDYHFTFCDVIPPSCIQMRNIILSAFPRNMRLPDPSTPNLKIDLLPEIREPPHILSEVDAALKAKQIKADVDDYLMTRQPGSFLTELKQKLLLPPSDTALAGTRYNVPLINSLVLYIGMQAIQQLQAKGPHSQSSTSVPPTKLLVDTALEVYQTLASELDTEGRYLLLNAVANQLRYPNNHTHYFSFILLYLFAETKQEVIQEQITRVLLERLIVNRPHPWGLLITFIELIKNPRYSFWNQSFIRCAPEIEKLFESVARSCGGPKPMDESMVSGWASENAH
ncbi:Ccr4-not transcription complex putative isoform 1 [Tripterygium wilfordii]|uniref:Ccr4-not transcription complex putative isoform 1 n=1 Tax=Tripterygium wilfordii TaxID=458696 RepID=A0A7J7CFI1_TRIWF|nr:CCR4-NOT transcription complex subunit 1-like [Tripterygium wilfordii]KAF5732911.1 Ccr4-not transcription complex putative isoform 1 [Tripterygium wilfordii]